MTFYEQKLMQTKESIYRNQAQIDSIVKIRKYIDQNFPHDLNLERLSQDHCLSKYHLLRLFKRYFGQTPRQYLIDKRVKAAGEHLSQGMSVTQTCYSVGFESLGSFSFLFKNRTGMSPLQYQKSNIREVSK